MIPTENILYMARERRSLSRESHYSVLFSIPLRTFSLLNNPLRMTVIAIGQRISHKDIILSLR